MRVRNCFFVVLLLLIAGNVHCQEIRVPRSINGSGKKDVTKELNEFFNSVPENSVVVFPKERVYKVEGILKIRNKRNVQIEGNGSSIIAETTGKDAMVPEGKPKYNWPRSREHLSIEGCRRITISRLIIRGAHASAGVAGDAYVKELEAQHGVNIIGSSEITLDSIRVTNVFGDCVYIGDGSAKQSSDSIVILNSFFGFTGRQGVAITHGNTIVIQGCEFTNIRRTHIDLEGNNARSVIKNVFIKNNTFGTSRLNWISAAGNGQTGDVFVVGNTLIGKEANATLGNPKYKNYGPFYFIGNTSDRAMGNPHGSAWRVVNVNGFYAEDNHIAVKKGRKMHLVGQSNSTNIVLKNNESEDMLAPLKDF